MNQRALATSVRRTAAYWATGIGVTAVFAVFDSGGGGISADFQIDLHTDMEIIATILAAIIGAMALARFYSKKEITFLFLGCGFLGAAFLEAVHTVLTSPFLLDRVPSDLPSLTAWSWSAARYFLAIAILLSWVAWRREERLGLRGRIDESTVYIGAGVIIVIVVPALALMPLPPAHFPGFPFPRPEEFGPALLFGLALFGYLKKGQWRRDFFEHCLVLFLILGVVGQAFFMSRSAALFDYEFDVGHVLKIASYVSVLIGLLGNTLAIYREAEQSERRFRSAISSMQEGFALYDRQDRLVVYNDEFVRLHPGLGDMIKPGVHFEDLVRVSAQRGFIVQAVGREEAFVRQRLRHHRNSLGPILRELTDGTWYIINESRMPDGGIAVIETDITELKGAEKALRAREKLTRQMLEASPVGVLIVTRDGRHLFANERALEIQGVTRDQLMAANAGEYYADPELRRRLKDDLYRTGFTPPTPVELLKPDGTHYYVILSSTLTEFEKQRAHLTYLYDISDLKRTEQALRESEGRLRSILNYANTEITLKDTDRRFIAVNRTFLENHRLTEEQVIGKTLSELFTDPAVQLYDSEERFVVETGQVSQRELPAIATPGVSHYLTTKFPVRDDAGRIFSIGTINTDITQLKRVERSLRDNEKRTRAIVDNIIDGIVTIDTSGVILSVNPAAARIFGYDERELIGQNVSTLMPEPHRSGHDRYLANYLATGVPKFMGALREVDGRRRNGRRFPMEVAVNELSFGHERLFVGIVRDITERKEMERLKGEFVSTVSHELRTPLTSIRGSLGLLSGGVIGKLPKKARAMIEVAEQNTARLIALVNDILDMEKIDSGSMKFRFAPVDLPRLVERGIEAHRGFAEQFGVDFVITQSAPRLVVRGDADRLTQVLANLLSNAAKFSPRGGDVEIAVAQHGAAARVLVSDRGPGIAKKFQKKIFGRFAQADTSDNRKAGGTGLGLNISKSIIEKHGGRLAFDTKVGTGTTFYFEVPLWEDTVDAVDEPAGTRRETEVIGR